MSGARRALFLFVLLGAALLFCRASAQTALVYLDERCALSVNEPYVRDDRTYARDAVIPGIRDSQGIEYKKTRDVCYYLFPVSVTAGEEPRLYITLPADQGITTAYLNGLPLSADAPVQIELSEQAELHVATGSVRMLARLCFTNLPVLVVTTGKNISKKLLDGALTLYDPDFAAHGQAAFQADYEIKIAYRGNSALNYSQKRPYKLSLYQAGEKLDAPLIGLRKDSDWILDSAFNDASRMRNRVCIDVWDDLCTLPWNYTLSGAIDGDYVELFVNGKYKGLYALNEKQDRKQLGLKKADENGTRSTLFKTTVTFSENNFSPAGFHTLGTKAPGAADVTRWYNVEITYPSSAYCTTLLWDRFYDFTAFVIESGGEFADGIGDYVYLDNLADYYLFNAAMNLTDNMRKNVVFARYDAEDARFDRFFLVPWDMDASLGREYSSNKGNAGYIAANKLFKRLLNESEAFREIVYARWQTLKGGALSVDNIMAHFERYYDEITCAGAAVREIEAHPKFTSYLKDAFSFNLNFEKEIAYIRTFMTKHLAMMDQQMEAYKP